MKPYQLRCRHPSTRYRGRWVELAPGVDSVSDVIRKMGALSLVWMELRSCESCWAVMPLGHAAESPVEVEIRAAEIAAKLTDNPRSDWQDLGLWPGGDGDGWRPTGSANGGELTGWIASKYEIELNETAPLDRLATPDEWVGYLAYVIYSHKDLA